MLRAILSLAVLAALGAPWPAAAQGRWAWGLDAGTAVPTARLAGAALETGFGFGANARYTLYPHLAAYAGWEWHRFRTEGLVAGDAVHLEDTGYTFGLLHDFPLRGRTRGWLRAGGLANHLEVEQEGDVIGDTRHGLGYEVGGGVAVPLGRRTTLTPGVRYREVARDLRVGDEVRSGTLSYVTISVGVVARF
jgi:hypothetical protein